MQDMSRQASQTLREYWGMLTQPQLVLFFRASFSRETLHSLVSVQVVGLTEELDLHFEYERLKAGR